MRLSEEEAREVHRILLEMTDRLRGYSDSIRQTLVTMAELELIFAKARFAAEFDCVVPRFGDRLLLKEARHPLLQDVLRRRHKSAVPISLELTKDRRTLLISGPNTGGKTVTLKTVGLLSLMAQSAIPVPALDAEFPLFEQVLADIGDYQSIQENLSTFSAHVSNIREMALDVTPDSLVLLDELGAATDPEEGGALGVAIVEHFRAAGAFTLVSTHLMALKIYGASTDGVVNGSMGFDEQTFEPTYILQLGLPGKSAGLEIATRLGIPEDIMNRARRSMSDRERDVTRFLSELHRRIEETTALEQQLREKVASIERREKELAHEWEKRETAKLKELERRTDQALAKFEEQAQEAIGKIAQGADRKKADQDAQRRIAKTKRELREDFQTTVLATQDDSRQGRIEPLRIAEGARVRLRDVRDPARVRRLLGNGRIEVEAGFMKMQVSVDDVIEVLPESAGAIGQAAEGRQLQARAGAGAGAPGGQRHRAARRGGARHGRRIPRPRRDGHRQPGADRAWPRNGRAQEDGPGDAQQASARRAVLSRAAAGGRRRRDDRGVAGVATPLRRQSLSHAAFALARALRFTAFAMAFCAGSGELASSSPYLRTTTFTRWRPNFLASARLGM